MAGSISYLAPVDNASGKIFGKKQRFVAVTRKKGSRPRGCAVTGTRSTPVTANELTHRQKFAAVTTSARARMIDPAFIQQDQAAYQANKHLYNSLWYYVFSQEWAAY